MADVEGDIAPVDDVLRITQIRLTYHLQVAAGFLDVAENRDKIDRALAAYADKCPAYQSVKECIDCVWKLELEAL